MKMGVTRIVEVVRECPWLKPWFLRVALSIILLLYVITGAAIFVVVMASSPQETTIRDNMARLRNDTAKLLVNELELQDGKKASQVIQNFLITYERELERTRILKPIDGLLGRFQNTGTLRKENRGFDFERSLYFTLSIITGTASGNLLRLRDTTQFFVILYSAVGVPLFLIWLCLLGRSMAQFWIMVCLHSCCCGMSPIERADISLFKRLFNHLSRRRCVTPKFSANPDEKTSSLPSTPKSTMNDLAASDRNVLVQPENLDEYFRLVRGDLFMPIWTLSLFFLLYAIFGATFGAVSHGASFMTAFFYGYMIFTTIGGVNLDLSLTTSPMSYLTRFDGDDPFTSIEDQQRSAAKVIWMLYFLIGYIILFGIIYLAYLHLTWRCTFCRKTSDQSTEKSSFDLTRYSKKSKTPVEIIPNRRALTPGRVLMGKKMVGPRRSSVDTPRQTTIELTTPTIEVELKTLAEEDEETKSNSSDSGISKTGSERMVEEDRQTVRSVRSIRNGDRISDRFSMKSGGEHSAQLSLSSKTKEDRIEEDIRDEKEPEGMMETDYEKDPEQEHVGIELEEGISKEEKNNQ